MLLLPIVNFALLEPTALEPLPVTRIVAFPFELPEAEIDWREKEKIRSEINT